ncbi:type I DNA topoisomerase [Planctomycetota bacterium]
MASSNKSDNGKNLVIVESPAKAKTISKYLGKGFEVMASMGHIRDLPSKSLSVDISNDFTPTYEIIPSRKKTLASLKKAAKNAMLVYLATDLDREGEAIAWHLIEALEIKIDRTRRVVFNAITKNAIQHAFAHLQNLDLDKVNAQQARRILDRIVGYEISPLLWKKVARGLSAGRVQSVAVKIIVDREREIQAFKPEEFWKITGIFSTENDPNLAKKYQDFLDSHPEKGKKPSKNKNLNGPTIAQRYKWLSQHNSIETQLVTFADENFRPDNQADAKKIHLALQSADFTVSEVKTKRTQSSPAAPFITSTLQQQAVNRLGFSTKLTMRTAQQLYEGVEISGQGSVGLITYMRTDSTHLASEAVRDVRKFIENSYGSEYLPAQSKVYSPSGKSAQQAHEAIRPTDVNLHPESLKNNLNKDQYRLYELIWNRFVACQMNPALWDVTNVVITADTKIGRAVFKTSGRKLVFDGFMRVSGLTTANGDQILPALAEKQGLYPIKLDPTQHFTAPPPRFTEASLVKTLEADGIGRPSTYAAIISTIQDRGYVEQLERKFHATDLGTVVTDKLNEHFPRIMDLAFTSHMEEQLDKIEEQHLDWVQVLREFYGPFKENLDQAHEQMNHAKAETQPSDYTCPKCKQPMVYRFGKNGRFLSCSAYPECKFAAPCDRDGKMFEPKTTEHKCPNCDKEMILRKGRFGTFLGCSGYPECKTTQKLDKNGDIVPPKAPPEPTDVSCHKCKEGELVIRQSKRGPFLGCGRFPRCRTIISIKQLENLKKLQSQGVWPPETPEEADHLLGRKKKTTAKKTAAQPSEKTTKKQKPRKKTAPQKTGA